MINVKSAEPTGDIWTKNMHHYLLFLLTWGTFLRVVSSPGIPEDLPPSRVSSVLGCPHVVAPTDGYPEIIVKIQTEYYYFAYILLPPTDILYIPNISEQLQHFCYSNHITSFDIKYVKTKQMKASTVPSY